MVAVRNESLINELKEALADLDYKPEIIPGELGVIEVSSFVSFDCSVDIHKISILIGYLLIMFHQQVARHPEAVTVVTGIVGCAGLKVYTLIFCY